MSTVVTAAELDAILGSVPQQAQASAAIDPIQPAKRMAADAPASQKLLAKMGRDYKAKLQLTNEETADEFLGRVDDMQKKVKEKVVNLFDAVYNGAKASVYTELAIDLLAKKGSVTCQDIRHMYLREGYKQGTANSQSNQLVHLFTGLKIAEKDGKNLRVNSASLLAERLRLR